MVRLLRDLLVGIVSSGASVLVTSFLTVHRGWWIGIAIVGGALGIAACELYERRKTKPSPLTGSASGGKGGGPGGGEPGEGGPFGGGGGGGGGSKKKGGPGGRGGIGAGGGGGGQGDEEGGAGGDGGPGLIWITPVDEHGNATEPGTLFLRPEAPQSHEFLETLKQNPPPKGMPEVVWTNEDGQATFIPPKP